jgi:anti-sigma B factor antagonist
MMKTDLTQSEVFDIVEDPTQTLAILKLKVNSLETANSTSVKAHIMQFLEQYSPQHVAVDVSRINYIDSFGLAGLVALVKNASPLGATLVLISPTSVVLQLVQMTRLDSLIEIYDTATEARVAISQKTVTP